MTIKLYSVTFDEEFRQARLNLGLSQKNLARQLGLPLSTIEGYEQPAERNGMYSRPPAALLARINHFFNNPVLHPYTPLMDVHDSYLFLELQRRGYALEIKESEVLRERDHIGFYKICTKEAVPADTPNDR